MQLKKENEDLKHANNLLKQQSRDDIANLESIVEDLAAKEEEFALAGDLEKQNQKIADLEDQFHDVIGQLKKENKVLKEEKNLQCQNLKECRDEIANLETKSIS